MPVPTLHVRNIPPDLYRRLKRLSASHGRSLSGEVVEILSQALRQDEARKRHNKALDNLMRMGRDLQRQRRGRPPAVDSLTLLRELRGE
jgi:plasmid stability protein